MSNTFEVTEDQARDIVYGDNPDFKVVEETERKNGRWCIQHDMVLKRLSDGTFWNTVFSVGATESQDQQAFEYDDSKFTQVYPHEVIKTIFTFEE